MAVRVAEACVCGAQIEIEMESSTSAFMHAATWRKEHNHETSPTYAVGTPVEVSDDTGSRTDGSGSDQLLLICYVVAALLLSVGVHLASYASS